MSRVGVLTPQFVEYIPAETKEGVLYISIPFATATHRCACGCGNVVVTPFTPTDWELMFDGETVSLDPSIGNWSFRCRSHYWITRNRVRWAPSWSQRDVDAGRARDRLAKDRDYTASPAEIARAAVPTAADGIWERIRSLFGRRRT